MLTSGYQAWIKSVLSMEPKNDKEAILKKYIKTILNAAYKYEGKAPLDDLVSVGITALLEAVECHDPEKGNLSAFIQTLIKNSLYNFAIVDSNPVKTTKYIISTASLIKRLRRSFEQHQPRDLGLCEDVVMDGIEGLEEHDLVPALRKEVKAILISIKDKADNNKVKYSTLVNNAFSYLDITIGGYEDTVGFNENERFDKYIKDLESASDLEEIYRLIQKLPNKQREAILTLLESSSNEEAAKKLGVTRQNIFKLKKTAVDYLKKHLIK